MATITSYGPISRRDARVLILGSAPSVASLAAGQYYGHPQNAFWRIMSELFGAHRELPYGARKKKLRENRVAVWDVLHQCRREGSLDSNIVASSEQTNDFATFFRKHRHIRAVFFNGTKTDAVYRKRVLPTLAEELRGLPSFRLPSTSPANATYRYEEKVEQWKQVLKWLSD